MAQLPAAIRNLGQASVRLTCTVSVVNFMRAQLWYAYDPVAQTGYYWDFDGTIYWYSGADPSVAIGQPTAPSYNSPGMTRTITVDFDSATGLHRVTATGSDGGFGAILESPQRALSPANTWVGFGSHQRYYLSPGVINTGETFEDFLAVPR